MSMRRGFSLIEMMVALAVGAILVLAAAAFASHQMIAFSAGNQNLDMTQMGRRALDVLRDDLMNAGAGVGYFEDGSFAGVALGGFALPGGAAFDSDNVPVVLPTGNVVTDDVGIMLADSEYVTIGEVIDANNIQICANSRFNVQDVVVLRSEDSISGKSVRVTGVQRPVACIGDVSCISGCEQLSFVDVPDFLSGPGAGAADYKGGFVAGGFKRITWFVTPGQNGGELRRAIGDCAQRDQTCGDVIADNVETVQMRVYTFTPPPVGSAPGTPGVWTDQTTAGPLTSFDPIRVDVELVLRTRNQQDTRQFDPVALVLEGGACVPDCVVKDKFRRTVLRASVFVRNAGRMRFAGPNT